MYVVRGVVATGPNLGLAGNAQSLILLHMLKNLKIGAPAGGFETPPRAMVNLKEMHT